MKILILVDTSARIEFLRYTDTPAGVSAEELLEDGSTTYNIGTCDAIRKEILASARYLHHPTEFYRLLLSLIAILAISVEFD